jgi:hypothetical protein
MPRDLWALHERMTEDFLAFDQNYRRARAVAEYRMALEKARSAKLLLEKFFPDDE